MLLNPKVLEAEYAVTGPLPQRADEIRTEMKIHPEKFPFSSITPLNIGNPQMLDQKPLTFVRQVLSLVEYPRLIEEPPAYIPADAVERARVLLENTGSVGAYSHSQGVPYIRERVADFIEKRDNYPADPEKIFLTAGAGGGASKIMTLLCHSPEDGLMVPIPQYPLYSASSSLNGSNFIGYHLEENSNWSTCLHEIQTQLDNAKARKVFPRILVVINPGNPTGAILKADQIQEIIELSVKEDLTIIADEVYQHNVFENQSDGFVSFKKVRSQLLEKDPSYENQRLVSLHSTSKGFLGECGHRGGYMEILGFPQIALDEIYKLACIDLCPPVTGQILTELMVNPPSPDGESYPLYMEERNYVLNTLKHRADLLYKAFVQMEGVECQKPQGAMYLFPQINIPAKACEEAGKQGLHPDSFYAIKLLENTGICVVPGNGFGQKHNTLHFRTTFLAPGGEDLSNKFIDFHKKFMDEFK